jgi:hypothetical protein
MYLIQLRAPVQPLGKEPAFRGPSISIDQIEGVNDATVEKLIPIFIHRLRVRLRSGSKALTLKASLSPELLLEGRVGSVIAVQRGDVNLQSIFFGLCKNNLQITYQITR